MNLSFTLKQKNIGEVGVFSSQNFKKGEVVLGKSSGSQKISLEEMKALSHTDLHYVGVFEGEFYLLPEPTRYLAHSCDPNLEWVNGVKYASREIGKGEELTIDYESGGHSLLGFKCQCGSKKCRGYIPGYKKF